MKKFIVLIVLSSVFSLAHAGQVYDSGPAVPDRTYKKPESIAIVLNVLKAEVGTKKAVVHEDNKMDIGSAVAAGYKVASIEIYRGYANGDQTLVLGFSPAGLNPVRYTIKSGSQLYFVPQNSLSKLE